MLANGKTILKQVLRDECLPALGDQGKYYNTEAVKTWLQKHKLRCPPATLNRYFHEFTQTGLVFAAGRGWYSSLATAFTLDHEPVSALVQELNKTFPLLDFSCWSTAQIGSYGHHLLAKFVAFVHTERDSMETVVEALRKTGWTAYLHPTRLEATKSFRQSDKTVVVRPAVSRRRWTANTPPSKKSSWICARKPLPCRCWTPGNTNGSWSISPGMNEFLWPSSINMPSGGI